MATDDLRVEHVDGVCVVALVGEHDRATVPVVEERVNALFAQRRSVVLDFSEVESIDSTLMRLVVHWARDAQLSSIESFAIVAGPAGGLAARTFRLVSVLALLPVFATRERAVDALADGLRPRDERTVEKLTDPELETEREAALRETVSGKTARIRDAAAGRLGDVSREQRRRDDEAD